MFLFCIFQLTDLLITVGGSSFKLVAIVVGGLAVLSLGLGFCYFMMSCGKKKDGKSTLFVDTSVEFYKSGTVFYASY